MAQHRVEREDASELLGESTGPLKGRLGDNCFGNCDGHHTVKNFHLVLRKLCEQGPRGTALYHTAFLSSSFDMVAQINFIHTS